MEARTVIATILHCGVLDADHFIRLIDAYDFDLYDLLDDVASYR